jgi:transposase
MRLAIGIDLHKMKAVAHAVYAGEGEIPERHQKFIDSFNKEFSNYGSEPEDMAEMANFLKGHEAHILIENSSKTNETYWVLVNRGLNVTVAFAADLYRITKSVKKTDKNDAIELAGYMRRRLDGEREFAVCTMPTREWMMRREMCRAVFNEKLHLADLKRRTRSHMLVHGIKLSRNYNDIFCKKAIAELLDTRDPCLRIFVSEAVALKKRTDEEAKHIQMMFANVRMFELIYSIPGFGLVSAAYITAMIMDISRFENSKKFTAYFGIVPKMRESADSSPRCATTHRGDIDARRIICQAANVHIWTVEESFVSIAFHRLRGAGKTHKEALVACGRMLMTVVYSVVKSDRPYTVDRALLDKAVENEIKMEDELGLI